MTTDPPTHRSYLKKCLALAEQSPPLPTNFRVGALLLSRKDDDSTFTEDRLLSTGYTMELAGNTHAEQCCLSNYAAVKKVCDDEVASILPVEPGRKLIMYVTMEPCGERSSDPTPCAQRIVRTKDNGNERIHKVYFGVKEPETFVEDSNGCQILTDAKIEWEHISGLEENILNVAFTGHEGGQDKARAALEKVSKTGDVASETAPGVTEMEEQPGNPMKRVMEWERSV